MTREQSLTITNVDRVEGELIYVLIENADPLLIVWKSFFLYSHAPCI
jgi:hypothetical protein